GAIADAESRADAGARSDRDRSRSVHALETPFERVVDLRHEVDVPFSPRLREQRSEREGVKPPSGRIDEPRLPCFVERTPGRQRRLDEDDPLRSPSGITPFGQRLVPQRESNVSEASRSRLHSGAAERMLDEGNA